MSKLKTIFWFIKRPQYIPQIFQVLKRKEFKAKENTAKESEIWCKQNCISKKEAIAKIIPNATLIHPKDDFLEYYQYAKSQEKACPVTMGGEGAIDLLYSLCFYLKSKRIIEKGVAYGWSSLAILLGINKDENARLISNDMPYIKMENDDFVGCIIPSEFKSKWELQRLPDVKGIPLAIKKFNHQIDFCHYDSDKSYTGRMFAYPILWKALVKGGVFVSDDIQDNIAFNLKLVSFYLITKNLICFNG